MNSATIDNSGLNEVQLSLLRLFNRPMSEEEALRIKKYLVDFYQSDLNKELESVIKEKGYTKKNFEDFLNLPS